ncbi:hypothetical protein [Caulobacter sp. NIBR1757]|uniref:hypothetical protein n=1 Tax=Caulobacter sp. NIBR1757 TaxID=3016000 RepID=UPI0022F143A9|nr:hypothetical protein [Caulobacter sp. NIBR1757]
MDRISPSTLRLVVVALGGCAVVGGWMGLSDSLRRSAPAWDQHPVSEGPAPVNGPPEAVAFDPKTVEKAPPPQAPPPVKAEAKTEVDPDPTADPTLATPAGTPPAAKTPPGTPKPAPRPTSKGDPIADVIQNTTAPAPKAEPPPEVPF